MQDDDRENELIWHHSYSTDKVKGVCIERKQETLIFQASLTPPDDVIVQFNNAIPVFMYSPSPPPQCAPPMCPRSRGIFPQDLVYCSFPPPDRRLPRWSAVPHVPGWRTPNRSAWPGSARPGCTRHMLILLRMLLLQASRYWRRSGC